MFDQENTSERHEDRSCLISVTLCRGRERYLVPIVVDKQAKSSVLFLISRVKCEVESSTYRTGRFLHIMSELLFVSLAPAIDLETHYENARQRSQKRHNARREICYISYTLHLGRGRLTEST